MQKFFEEKSAHYSYLTRIDARVFKSLNYENVAYVAGGYNALTKEK